jgi:hypothetical protein
VLVQSSTIEPKRFDTLPVPDANQKPYINSQTHGVVQKVLPMGLYTHKSCVLAVLCGNNLPLQEYTWGINLQKITFWTAPTLEK